MTTNKDPVDDPLKEQPFVSHLLELRDRLLRAVVAVALIFVVLFPFANEIYIWVASPLMAHLPQGTSMIATEVASPFLTPFKLSLVASVFLAMPFILYQLWAFIAPGLYRHEKQLAVPLVASSAVLFYVGMLFAYYAVFPLVFAFLTGTVPDGVTVATDIAKYLDFILTLFFAFGMAFEVPIATFIMVRMGVTTPEKLAEKRPYIIVGAFLIGMLLTPPDVISQTLLAIPMWLLFEIGLLFSRLFGIESGQREAPQTGGEQAASGSSGVSNAGLVSAATGKGWQPPESPVPTFDGDPGPGPAGGNAVSPDARRFVPLTPEELDAELDIIEAEEEARDDLAQDSWRDPVEDKLQRIQQFRDAGDVPAARKLLYEVLVSGNQDQVKVARNILEQLDDL
ncbi:MAG: twin-arginine translocase subunit TatC [Gammaproteobacteria bacterium]|nr:twin-arginine translocase subunit TatC [Gammaproteobacteria bacterium]